MKARRIRPTTGWHRPPKPAKSPSRIDILADLAVVPARVQALGPGHVHAWFARKVGGESMRHIVEQAREQLAKSRKATARLHEQAIAETEPEPTAVAGVPS